MKFRFNKKALKITGIAAGSVMLVFIAVVVAYYFHIRSIIYNPTVKANSNEIQYNTAEEDGIQLEEQKGITNILLIGTDGRDLKEQARSDSMIILTIDDNNKKVKLTSIMRDTYVEIKGRKTQKINASYAIGGPELLMDTIERNFKIKLDKYIIVNFWGFQDIVDAIGGLDINVKNYEIDEMNKFIGEVSEKKSQSIVNPGLQHLDGQQVLAYSRIRHVGDGSYERTLRQRNVLSLIANKLKYTSKAQYPKLLSTLLPYVKTNIEPISLLNYAYTVSKFTPLEIGQLQIPVNEISDGRIYNGTWVLLIDKEQTSKVLNDFIFRDKITKPTELDIKSWKNILQEYLKVEEKPTNGENKEPADSNKGEPIESDHKPVN